MHPRGLVELLAGLMTPGVRFIVVCPSFFQPWIAKNLMFMCQDCPVGLFALMISMANWLPSCIGVGSLIGSPSLLSMGCMHLMFFAALTVTVSLALVELDAVIDWAFD